MDNNAKFEEELQKNMHNDLSGIAEGAVTEPAQVTEQMQMQDAASDEKDNEEQPIEGQPVAATGGKRRKSSKKSKKSKKHHRKSNRKSRKHRRKSHRK